MQRICYLLKISEAIVPEIIYDCTLLHMTSLFRVFVKCFSAQNVIIIFIIEILLLLPLINKALWDIMKHFSGKRQ